MALKTYIHFNPKREWMVCHSGLAAHAVRYPSELVLKVKIYNLFVCRGEAGREQALIYSSRRREKGWLCFFRRTLLWAMRLAFCKSDNTRARLHCLINCRKLDVSHQVTGIGWQWKILPQLQNQQQPTLSGGTRSHGHRDRSNLNTSHGLIFSWVVIQHPRKSCMLHVRALQKYYSRPRAPFERTILVQTLSCPSVVIACASRISSISTSGERGVPSWEEQL